MTKADSPQQILRDYNLRPKKNWGQNFLSDQFTLNRIVQTCGLDKDNVVVELGAGLGHLTRELAATGARVVAVERDRDLVSILENELNLANVRIVAANAANINYAQISGVSKPVVVGNLPYQLSSSILFEIFEQNNSIKRAVFLLQKEVAERIAAPPGGRDYGLLSVLLQAVARVEVVFNVPAGLFHPPPKVDSAVVAIHLLEKPLAPMHDKTRFVRLVKAAFSQRRKTLWNALKSGGERAGLGNSEAIAAALDAAAIDPNRRAETLSPIDYLTIERVLTVTDS